MYFEKLKSGKWSAEIWDPSLRVRRWLRMFSTAEMAAHAYDEEAAGLVGRRLTRRSAKTEEGIGNKDDCERYIGKLLPTLIREGKQGLGV